MIVRVRRKAAALAGAVLVLVLVATTLISAGFDGTAAAASGSARRSCVPVQVTIDGVPEVANPFDPAQIDLRVEFRGPKGRSVWVVAYRNRPFRRALVDGREVVTPTGAERWSARATLAASGRWTWTASIVTPGRRTTVDSGSVVCAKARGHHGVLRVAPGSSSRLSWSDGTPYIALGENLGWAGPRGTFDYDDWLDQLAQHGATWIRVWMPSWGFAIEGIERDPSGAVVSTSLGRYSARLDRAWQLDRVITGAARRGIVVQLVIQNHGAFSTMINPDWDDNPYNIANGGPLTNPRDVFTDRAARELFERRIRYLVARWGWAPNLIWEFWNEVDWVSTDVATVAAWHRDMARLIDRLDPYDHLITTSVGNASDFVGGSSTWAPLWSLPEIDLVQVHLYGVGRDIPFNFTQLVIGNADRGARYGKPWHLGEVGVDFRSGESTLLADPTFQGLTEAAWSGVFAGGVGSGMTWWWDSVVAPNDAYPFFLDGLVALFRDPRGRTATLARTDAMAVAGSTALQAYALGDDDAAVVWVRNPNDWWAHPDPATVPGGRLTLPDLTAGVWDATWLDPSTGQQEAGGTIRVGTAVNANAIDVPPFSRAIALRLLRTA